MVTIALRQRDRKLTAQYAACVIKTIGSNCWQAGENAGDSKSEFYHLAPVIRGQARTPALPGLEWVTVLDVEAECGLEARAPRTRVTVLDVEARAPRRA